MPGLIFVPSLVAGMDDLPLIYGLFALDQVLPIRGSYIF